MGEPVSHSLPLGLTRAIPARELGPSCSYYESSSTCRKIVTTPPILTL